MVAFVVIICAIGGLLGGFWLVTKVASSGIVVSQPTTIPRIYFTSTNLLAQEISTEAIVMASTPPQFTAVQQPATVASAGSSLSDPVSPEQFIRDYFSAINDRKYELAWSMLSKKFQANHTYSEYTSWWNTVEKLEVILIDIKSQNNSVVYVYVEAYYYYKSGEKTTGHTTITAQG